MPNHTHAVAVLWNPAPEEGQVHVVHGELASLTLECGGKPAGPNRFLCSTPGPCRMVVAIADSHTGPGAMATRIEIAAGTRSFTFFLRDVSSAHALHIPEYGVAVVPETDKRSYETIVADIRGKGHSSALQRYESEAEETFENACAGNRDLSCCPTWLGLGRDMRLFEVGYHPLYNYWGYVKPRYHYEPQKIPESAGRECHVGFDIGPGAACRDPIVRRLEDGVLPILRSTQTWEEMHYHLTAFCSLEKGPPSDKAVRGSDPRAVYPNTAGHMLSAAELDSLRPLLDREMHHREQETVCVIHVEAVNTGSTPRYAWFKGLHFRPAARPEGAPPEHYDGATGRVVLPSGRVLGINRLNGSPMPQLEMAVLVPPGGKAVLDMLIPHQPLPPARARRLAALDVERHLDGVRSLWQSRLDTAASVHVPEPAIDERIRAGLLHCDLFAQGRRDDGPLLPTIGCYSPIGSESSPIIQFFDSMGRHDLAERSIQFFLDRQRPDGFIQNFGGYQLETGPVLWTMGEHFRYTRDRAWVRRVKPHILKACEYLLAWRNRNRKPELRGRGYGLLDGKVADPEDFFHSFMLNGLSCLGVARAAEMLAAVSPADSRRLSRVASAWRRDIRTAFAEAMARSPAVPTGDGSWVPSCPPWTEYPGPVSLYAEGGAWSTHGAFGARDSLIGSLYLVLCEVLDPNEPAADFLLRMHHELFTVRNAGFSQPYYCRHDYIHARRGEVKAFLKTFYNQCAALQDRETYTFWEHYFHVSQHKTHEEGWFLMQTRWMLWMEERDRLRLLPLIPRRWLEDGNVIDLDRVATYFGPAGLHVVSDLSRGRITAEISCPGPRRPKALSIRLPHPESRTPAAVVGGRYNRDTETVTVRPFSGRACVELAF